MKKNYPFCLPAKCLGAMLGLFCSWLGVLKAQTVTLTGSTVYRSFSTNTHFVVPGKTDVHFTADDSVYTNCTVALNSNDAWLFYDNIRPEKVISTYLQGVTINGSPARVTSNVNVRVSVYKNGTAVIPNGNIVSQSALQVFKQQGLAGTSNTYGVGGTHDTLGAFDNSIRSFKLKRGHMATFANNRDGSGFSRVFIANDADLIVSVMPDGLDASASFIRVFTWSWPSKKGKAGWSPDQLGCTWYYDWNIGGNSTAANYEYAAIRQNAYWPSLWAIANKPNVNHLLGFNEPDRPDQSNINQDWAISIWPELMKTGQRLGSPSPSDPFNGWLRPFLDKAEALNYRVDYVAIHCYWGGFSPQQWYDRLRYVWELYGRRPLWITEWNNGANWTNEYWPPNQNDQFQKQLNDMRGILQVLDTASFVERYAEYDWVEDKRALILGDTLTPAGKYYFANKSDFAYKPSWSFVHNWKLMTPTISGSIQDSNYSKVNISWWHANGESGTKFLVERKIEGRDADFVPVQYITNYNAGENVSFTDSVYGTTTYRVKTMAKDTTNYNYSNTVEIVKDLPPVAPSSLTGTPISATQIQLNWNAGAYGRAYNLKRSSSPNGPFDTIVAARTTAYSYLDTGLAANKTYYYVVTSLNAAGESNRSAVLSVKTNPITIPVAVPNPRIASGDTKATLTWGFRYDARYKIVRSLSQSGTYDTIATNLNALRYVDNGRTNGTSYYYKIIAYNSAGTAVSPILKAIPQQGQQVYISLEDTATTQSADTWGGYHATFVGNARRDSGRYATGLLLSGSGDAYATLEDGVTEGLNNFTIATWVKLNSLANWARIFDFGTSPGNFMKLTPQSYASNGMSNINYSIMSNGVEQSINYLYSWTTNTWTHLALSQSNDSIKLYINGVQVASSAGITLRPAHLGTTNRNYLGKSQYNDPLLNGTIDEFRIYNYALNSTAINTLYNQSVLVAPSGVMGVRVASGDTRATLTWGTQLGVKYKIVRSSSQNGVYDTIATNISALRYVDSNRTNGTSYYYKVVAYNAAGAAASTVLKATPTAGQQLYFSFNDTESGIAVDTWGAFHASFVGNVQRTTNASGSSVKLDADPGTYCSLVEAPVRGINNFSIATWVKVNTLSNWARIFDFGTGVDNFMFLTPQTGVSNGKSIIRYGIKNSTADQGFQYAYTWQPGTWTHLAITQSGDTARMYINGVPVSSGVITIKPSGLGATTRNYLGKSQFNDPNLDASLDEFRIYNYALNNAEVAALFNSAGSVVPVPAIVQNIRVASGDGRVTLTWSARTDVKYKVLRSLSQNGTYDTIATDLNIAKYVDGSRINGTNYYYKLLAYNAAGTSALTNAVAAKPVQGQHISINFEDDAPTITQDSWNAFDASLAGGAARQYGQVGKALYLNGKSDSYAVLDSGAISELNNFTIGMWVKPSSLSNWTRLFDFGTGTSTFMNLTPQSYYANGKSNIRYSIMNGSTNQWLEFQYAWKMNTWTHLALTQSGDSTRLFINGTQVASTAAITLRPVNLGMTRQNYIGKSQYNDPFFNGCIDEFRIYNYAVSGSQLRNLFGIMPVVESPRIASGDTKLTLTWTNRNDESKYKIVRSLSQNGTYDTIATNIGTNRYVDGGRTNGMTCYYKIIAYNTVGTSVSPVLTATPVAGQHLYVSFNDNVPGLAEDAWGGYHAVLAEAATREANPTGKNLLLNGAAVSFATLGEGAVSGLNNFTIASWVKPGALANWMRIFDFGSNSDTYMFLTVQAWYSNNTPILRYGIKNGGSEQSISYPYNWDLNRWVHVALTQSNDSTKLYVNGVQVATTTAISLRPFNLGTTTRNYLGKSQFDDPLYNGGIDEFRIYNYALNSTEVKNVYGVAPVLILAAIQDMYVAAGDGRVTLTWASLQNVNYKILRSVSANGMYDTIASDLRYGRYVDNGRTNGTTYYYKMIAYNAGGNGVATSAIVAQPVQGRHVSISFDDSSATAANDSWNAFNAGFTSAAIRESGKIGNALRLNGTGDSYAALYNGLVSELSNFTISCWVKANSVANWARVFDFGNGTNNNMFLTLQAGTTDSLSNVRYSIKNGGSEQQVSFPYKVPLNTWVHYTISQSGNTAKLYINGTLVATNNAISIRPADLGNTFQNYIGKSQYNDPGLDASVDQFRIHNYALSDQEIQTLATEGSSSARMTDFVANPAMEGNEVQWKLTDPGENMQMELEKSEDAKDFTSIYQVKASTIGQSQQFRYTDVTAGNLSYYRVKMTGKDGKVVYLAPIAVAKPLPAFTDVSLYPNIVNSTTTLQLTTVKNTSLRIAIVDMNGRSVQTLQYALGSGRNLVKIDASRWVPGTYNMVLMDAEHHRGQTLKLIVSR